MGQQRSRRFHWTISCPARHTPEMRERTNDVEIERDVKVTMPDGVVLLTDVYHPVGVDDAPTLLERTPYGRQGMASGAGPEFAARGYRYVLQACRGTDGSGGTHSYFAEAPDGRATADWIAEQSWFDGRLGSYGASYMGFTQWALASTHPPHLQAMAVALSTSVRKFSWYPGDSLALEVIIPWDLGAVMFNKPQPAAIVEDITPEAIEKRMAQLLPAFDHLPLGDVIRHLTGEDLPLYQDQLAHAGRDDPFWAAVDFRGMLHDWRIPILLVDGWHDYPLPGVLEDYAILRDSPAPVRLRIGAGGHLGGGGEGGMTEAPLDWFDTYLRDQPGLLPERPVTVQVQGEGGEWRDFDDWPPPATPTTWYLHADGRLATDAPATGLGPRPVPLRPHRPHAVSGWHRHVDRRRARQPGARSTRRRRRVHERRARRAAGARRTRLGGVARDVDARPRRLLRTRLRCAPRRQFVQRVRRAAALRPRLDHPRRRGRLRREHRGVAHRAPIRGRSPSPGAGLERLPPRVRPQPRHR